jgi:chorismate mutase / prephenate dehydratase
MPSPAHLDAPSVPAAMAEEPPPQDGWPDGLVALRAELDRIDDALHALLRQRAGVVERVARSGKRGAYRPGREAAMLRRLLRQHSGTLPAQAIVRIWRELLAGTTAMQGLFAVAVCEAGVGARFTQAAREHFGALTPLHAYGRPAQALADVSNGTAAVAVLPMPSESDATGDVWWTALLREDTGRIHVVARLPFWAPRPEGAPTVQALVVAATEPDASGRDRSLLGLELDQDVSRARLTAALTSAGFAPDTVILCRERGKSAAYALADVEGFLADDDPRLDTLETVLRRPVVVGAYAIPETGAAE